MFTWTIQNLLKDQLLARYKVQEEKWPLDCGEGSHFVWLPLWEPESESIYLYKINIEELRNSGIRGLKDIHFFDRIGWSGRNIIMPVSDLLYLKI